MLNIALISFEFPPAVAVGGIGTYAWEAAKTLATSGHRVEVFAAGKSQSEPAAEFGVKVHRVDVADRIEFRTAVVNPFQVRHLEHAFDILESPEIGAEGVMVARLFPEVGRVVKLHTPNYILQQIGSSEPTLFERIRFSIGALRRGRVGFLRNPKYLINEDLEREWTLEADEVVGPSKSISDWLSRDWLLDSSQVVTIPYMYSPSSQLTNIPLPNKACTIGFLGRLEQRKGIIDLTYAIPEIVRAFPGVRFRMLGPSWPYKKTDMQKWMNHQLGKYRSFVDFSGQISHHHLAEEIANCDIMVLPSRWENFPFACWESMASGRCVVGSSEGGMSEVIEDGISGHLVPPNHPHVLALKLISLLGNLEEVRRIGEKGRQRVCSLLDPLRIVPLQIASYHRAIAHAKYRLSQCSATQCRQRFSSF